MPSDIEHCRALLRGGSRTFHAASFLLPASVRAPAAAVYAFCRLADDAIDAGDDAAAELVQLRGRLDRIYAGTPDERPADRAFAAVVVRYAIPRALPAALLQGFEWDAANRRYETIEDVCDYAVRVAGTVGAMMTLLMERRAPGTLARAIDLGVAMQLTNIARDVGEDARLGRLYLPAAWLREAGIDPERFLAQPRFEPALADVVRRLLAAADGFYRRAETGIAHLPWECRFAIMAARRLYAEIGAEVARNGYDGVSRRAVVSGRRKLMLLPSAAGALLAARRDADVPALSQAAFLVDAVLEMRPSRAGEAAMPAWWNLHERWVRVLEMFERLERREQLRRAGS